MKMSVNWLRSLVGDISLPVPELAERMSAAGLEVESIDALGPLPTGVVVAEVVACEQHPDADRLRVCQVSTGSGDPLTVVCGAPNAREGIKVALIQVGGTLPSGDAIKACKLRGVPSSGMLCSSEELGLGASLNKGIIELPADAPVGEDFVTYLGLDDQVFDIAITPNRGDALGMVGLAREVRALLGKDHEPVSFAAVSDTIADVVSVDLKEAEACPSYVGRVIRGVSMDKPLPWWMRERLRRAGINVTGNPVVDCVNYVMIETGQPMHAFDHSKLQGNVSVRYASSDESLVLLDDRSIELTDTTLVVADDSGPIALAGAMGGKSTAVSDETCDLYLEAAHFKSDVVGHSARSHQVFTDGSYRWERGVDWNMPVPSMERLTQLLLDIVGGEVGPLHETHAAELSSTDISLPKTMIKRYLGVDIPDNDVVTYLERLGFQVTVQDDAWQVLVPSFRLDVTRSVDLIEEVGRMHGYDTIASQPLRGVLFMPEDAVSAKHRSVMQLKQFMVGHGFQEVVTYSFVAPELDHVLALDQSLSAVKLANPISEDMSVMRRSLWPGLLDVWAHNSKRQCARMQIFEYGQCFLPGASGQVSDCVQEDRLAGLLAGQRHEDHWQCDSNPFDFFDAKRAVMRLLSQWHITVSCEPSEHPALHPHQQAALVTPAGEMVGHVGQCHPRLLEERSIKGQPILFEVKADFFLSKSLVTCQPISKYPTVRRDLSFVMPEEVPAELVDNIIRKKAGYLLIKLNIFDIFRSEGLGEGRKSVSYGLFFQDVSRTLVDAEIDAIIQSIVEDLSSQHDIYLRE